MMRGDTCMNTSGDAGIEACKRVIQSGPWSPSRQAFAYGRLGGLYQSVGNDEQAIAITPDFVPDLSSAAEGLKRMNASS